MQLHGWNGELARCGEVPRLGIHLKRNVHEGRSDCQMETHQATTPPRRSRNVFFYLERAAASLDPALYTPWSGWRHVAYFITWYVLGIR